MELELARATDDLTTNPMDYDFSKVKISNKLLSQFREAIKLNIISMAEIFSNKLTAMGGEEQAKTYSQKLETRNQDLMTLMELVVLPWRITVSDSIKKISPPPNR